MSGHAHPKRDEVIQYVLDHPRESATEVAKKFGVKLNDVSRWMCRYRKGVRTTLQADAAGAALLADLARPVQYERRNPKLVVLPDPAPESDSSTAPTPPALPTLTEMRKSFGQRALGLIERRLAFLENPDNIGTRAEGVVIQTLRVLTQDLERLAALEANATTSPSELDVRTEEGRKKIEEELKHLPEELAAAFGGGS